MIFLVLTVFIPNCTPNHVITYMNNWRISVLETVQQFTALTQLGKMAISYSIEQLYCTFSVAITCHYNTFQFHQEAVEQKEHTHLGKTAISYSIEQMYCTFSVTITFHYNTFQFHQEAVLVMFFFTLFSYPNP